jgi:multisubunit Na+/H+ antiporter MnhF subunit
MEIPHELFYLSALLFAVLAVVVFFRAYREKEKYYNMVGVLCLLGFIWSIMFVLDQVLLAGIF